MGARRAVEVVAVAALVAGLSALAGCSGGGGEASGQPTFERPDGAMDEFMDRLSAGHETDEGTLLNQAEDVVAACMSDLGFEYEPVDHTAGEVETAYDLGLVTGSPEYAAQFGYGISTDPMGVYARGAEVVDPNAAYVAGLSADGRAEYLKALFGVLAQPEDETLGDVAARAEAVVTSTWDQQGCYGRGQHETDESAYLEAMNSAEALIQEIVDLDSTVEADDRIAPLVAAWAGCMADAGYPDYRKVSDPADELTSRWQGLWAKESAASEGGSGPTAADAATAAVAKAVQAEMGDEEIAIAVADVGCRLSTGYQATWNEVRLDVENRFYAEHEAELEAWAELVAAAG